MALFAFLLPHHLFQAVCMITIPEFTEINECVHVLSSSFRDLESLHPRMNTWIQYCVNILSQKRNFFEYLQIPLV